MDEVNKHIPEPQDDDDQAATLVEKLTLMENPVYLGDAVYAYFQDDRVELRLNHHDAKGAVCPQRSRCYMPLLILVGFSADSPLKKWKNCMRYSGAISRNLNGGNRNEKERQKTRGISGMVTGQKA